VEQEQLRALAHAIAPGLIRYPSVDPGRFLEAVERVLENEP
jgi:hypothetical protein